MVVPSIQLARTIVNQHHTIVYVGHSGFSYKGDIEKLLDLHLDQKYSNGLPRLPRLPLLPLRRGDRHLVIRFGR